MTRALTTPLRARWLVLAAFVGACGEQHVPRDDETVGTLPVQWRVVWTESPQTRAVVSWSTAEPGASHRVHLDTAPQDGSRGGYARVVDATRNGRYATDGLGSQPVLHYHHAELEDLVPATTYWFVIESDGRTSPELHFETAPDDDRPFAIVSGSDSRSDRTQRRVMNRRIAAIAAADPDVKAFAHGGDYVWAGHELDDFSRWLTDFELTVTPDGRVLPIVPTRGNHETVGKLFDEVFCWPGGGLGRNYFATRLSRDVLLLTLNSEIAAGGDQSEFLDATLTEGRGVRWQLAQYHRPNYPSVKQPSHSKPHWVPLFDKHRLDLAIESDGHTLKRTMPIRDDKPTDGGVVYIGEGGLGVKQRSPDRSRWYLKPPAVVKSAYHVWKIRFERDQMRFEAIGADGGILDSATIGPRAR